MRELYIKPQIHSFESFEAFAKEFALDEKDLIFTEQFIYDTFIKNLGLPCKVVMRDPYGLGEPSDEMIDRIYKEARKHDFKRILAVGGGSVIDIGKVLALQSACPSTQAFTRAIPIIKERELVILPTTCGTGSEVTNISIAALKSKGTKLGLVDEALYADHAVLIPELVKELPYKFFVYSAVDALVHAAESYVAKRASRLSELLSLQACEMILSGFAKVIRNGEEYRKHIIGDFLLASNIAGIAFANAGVGPVHALAYPLGGKYHVPHGESNYQFLSSVFSVYMREKPGKKLDDLGEVIGKALTSAGMDVKGADIFIKLEEFLGRLLPLKPLREYGMQQSDIAEFTQSVIDNQQRLLVNSYIPFDYDIICDIYRARY